MIETKYLKEFHKFLADYYHTFTVYCLLLYLLNLFFVAQKDSYIISHIEKINHYPILSICRTF